MHPTGPGLDRPLPLSLPLASAHRASRAMSFARAAVGVVAVVAGLSGCAILNTVDSEVTTFGSWPADRAPGRFAFDRLPSQDRHPARQARLEQAATAALAGAGFQPAADPATADVVVQVGARVDVTEITPWADPLWWHGPYGPYGPWPGPYLVGPWPRPVWGPGPWWGPGPLDRDTRYSRQVALLIRDRATGKPLYEAHAESSGGTAGSERLIAAMMVAAMSDFPRNDEHPRVVRTMLPPPPAVAAGTPAAAEALPAASAPPARTP